MRVRGRSSDRVLATVMFTDIVGSTELAGRIGDRAWKSLLARHDGVVRRELKRFGGRELDNAGDGFFVMFDRPAQAIDCARAILGGVAALELEVRAAIHMGEAEVMGRKVGGIAVHAASRVLGVAGPAEILVTGIVRDVVAGADTDFADRGVHELRGVPGEWRLFAVEPTTSDEAPATFGEATPTTRNWPLILALTGAVALAAALGTASPVALALGGFGNASLVGASAEQLAGWGYGDVEVPNVDSRIEACIPLTGAAQFECWAALDQYMMQNVVSSVPCTSGVLTVLASRRVIGYSWDELATAPAYDRVELTP